MQTPSHSQTHLLSFRSLFRFRIVAASTPCPPRLFQVSLSLSFRTFRCTESIRSCSRPRVTRRLQTSAFFFSPRSFCVSRTDISSTRISFPPSSSSFPSRTGFAEVDSRPPRSASMATTMMMMMMMMMMQMSSSFQHDFFDEMKTARRILLLLCDHHPHRPQKP